MNNAIRSRPAAGVQPSRPPARRSIFSEIGHLWPATLLLYAILIPQEARIEVAGVALFAYRLVCLALLPWVVSQVLKGRFRFHVIDVLMVVGSLWMIVSLAVVLGLPGIVSGTGIAIDVLVPYLVARSSIRSLTDLRRLLVIFAPGIFAAGLVLLLETLSGRLLIRPAMEAIFGARDEFLTGTSGRGGFRFGLLRASGPFAHPILAGTILTSVGALFLASGLRRWPYFFGVLTFPLSLFSISSAAILSIVLVAGGTLFDRISRHLPFANWPILIAGTSIVALFIQIASENGLVRFLIRFTLNPQTGYFRTLVWDFGIDSVSKHPWFGIAFDHYERLYWMNNSVDAYWLSDAIRHGVITPLCLFTASIYAVVGVGVLSLRAANEADRRFYIGIAITIGVLVLIGFTVAFYGGVLLWYYFVLGAATSLAAHAMPQRPRQAPLSRAARS